MLPRLSVRGSIVFAFTCVMMAAFALNGCSSFEYQGASPSLRRMADHPAASDYYVGVDANFSVDHSSGYHSQWQPQRPAAAASPEATVTSTSTP